MTKDMHKVLDEFTAGRRFSSGTLSTDGTTIFSYMFPIAKRMPSGVYLIKSYPSKTTQRAINDLAREFPHAERVNDL